MKMIFWGLVLVFVNFHLTLNSVRIGLLPDFAGYWLIYKGVQEVRECRTYGSMSNALIGAVIWSILMWVVDFVGLWQAQTITGVLGTVSTVIKLYVTYRLAQGVMELESVKERDLSAKALMTAWKVGFVCSVVSCVVFFAPILGLMAAVAAFVSLMWYLYLFYQSRKGYESVWGGAL